MAKRGFFGGFVGQNSPNVPIRGATRERTRNPDAMPAENTGLRPEAHPGMTATPLRANPIQTLCVLLIPGLRPERRIPE